MTVLKDLLSEHGHQFATITPVVKTIPPSSVGDHLQHQGRPDGEGGQDRLRRQLQPQRPHAAQRDGEHQADRHSALHHPGEPVRRAPSTPASWTRTPSACGRPIATAATSWRRPATPQTHVRDEGGLNWFTLRPSTGKRIDILMPVEEGERYKLGGITFTGNKTFTNTEALRAQFTQKDGEWFNATDVRQGAEGAAQGLRQPGLHQHGGQPRSRGATTPRSWSTGTSISTRASSSTSRASSSPATRSRATRSSGANCCWRKARSTTASCGTSPSCA